MPSYSLTSQFKFHWSLTIVCKALVPFPRISERYWSPPLFFLHPKLEEMVAPFLNPKFRDFLCAKFKVLSLCRHHCKNTFYYHLSMVSTINVQRDCDFCCRMQIFEEMHAIMSLKFHIFLKFQYLSSPLSKKGGYTMLTQLWIQNDKNKVLEFVWIDIFTKLCLC